MTVAIEPRHQAAESTDASFIDREAPGEHFQMKPFEQVSVTISELGRRPAPELGVGSLQRLERQVGAVPMIEQRVVEIEEDGTGGHGTEYRTVMASAGVFENLSRRGGPGPGRHGRPNRLDGILNVRP